MILKSYIVEKDHKILSKFKSVLMYGENQGIKEDIREKIIKEAQDKISKDDVSDKEKYIYSYKISSLEKTN